MKVKEDFLQGVSNCSWNKTLEGRRKLSTAECCGPRKGRWASLTAGVGAVLKDVAVTSQGLFALELVVRRWF